MYINTKNITVDPAFVFTRDHLLAITGLLEKTVFASCGRVESHINCRIDSRSIGGSLSALRNINPDAAIDSFTISFQAGDAGSFTVDLPNHSSNVVIATISHPSPQLSLSLLDDFCRQFPVCG